MAKITEEVFFDFLRQSSSFCVNPFIQLSTVPAGFIRPCCVYTHFIKNDQKQLMNVSSYSFQQAWNSQDLKSARMAMFKNQKLEGCIQCHQEEAFGQISMRTRDNSNWLENPDVQKDILRAFENEGEVLSSPRYFELKPGNTCNLRCRMCNQFDSSSIAAELQTLATKLNSIKVKSRARLFDDANFEVDFDLSKMADWRNNPQIWESLEKIIPSLEFLSIAGGEPTLIKEVYQVLEKCVQTGHSKHIEVYFATNLTQDLTAYLELSKYFKQFNFTCSVDGLGQVQEYIRYPSSWDKISSRFEQIVDFCKLHPMVTTGVNFTLSIYNVLHLPDFLYWIEQPKHKNNYGPYLYMVNILAHPEYLSIRYFPPKYRLMAIQKIKDYMKSSWVLKEASFLRFRVAQVVNMLESPIPNDAKNRWLQLWHFSKILDEHRKQSFKDALPEVYSGLIEALGSDISSELQEL